MADTLVIPSSLFMEFADRARKVGALAWWMDEGGVLAADSLEAWPSLLAAMQEWARSPDRAETQELFPGCNLLALPDRGGTIVAIVLSKALSGNPEFQGIGLSTRDQLIPLIHDGTTAVARTIQSLRYFHSDLQRSDEHGKLAATFSEQLSQSYEEANLLFRMSRYLNSENDPPKVFSLLCAEVIEVLPFQWMAIWLNDQAEVLPALKGTLTSVGQLPVNVDEFTNIAGELCREAGQDNTARVLVPARNRLAAVATAEVLAQPIAHDGRSIGVLLAGNKRGSDPDISSGDIQILGAIVDFLGVFHENMARTAEQRTLFLGTLSALAAAIDAKDRYTKGHSNRVALLAAKLAKAMGLPQRDIEQFQIAGQLHDVGKIGVPEWILGKAARLTDDEFEHIKKHPEVGYHILKGIPSLENILPGVLHHHERWDGRGYPGNLVGENIPVVARVLALADTFDAMSSNRAYRVALTREYVLAEIRKCSGTQFSPELAAKFIALDFADFDEMLARRS